MVGVSEGDFALPIPTPHAYARSHAPTHVWSYGALWDFRPIPDPGGGVPVPCGAFRPFPTPPARSAVRHSAHAVTVRLYFRPAYARICRAVPPLRRIFAPIFRFSVPGFYRPDPLNAVPSGVCKPYTTFFSAWIFEYRCFVSL